MDWASEGMNNEAVLIWVNLAFAIAVITLFVGVWWAAA
jgi:hypothetical protein